MPEQLALEQVIRQRGAVHPHEGRVVARRVPVDRFGHPLLPRAGLALDQDGGVRGGHLVDDLEDFAHRGGIADEAVAIGGIGERLGHRAETHHQPLVLHGPLDLHLEGLERQRLLQVVEGARLHRLDGPGAVLAGNDDQGAGVGRARLAKDLQTVRAADAMSGDHQVKHLLLDLLEGVFPGLGDLDLVPAAAHRLDEAVAQAPVVLGNQDILHASGSSARIVLEVMLNTTG